VTENLYGWDDFDESGLIIHKRGDLKTYQEVIAVGDDVSFVKPGDVVEINLYKYCSFENDENSIKVNGTNKIVNLHLNEIEMVGTDGESVTCFLIDQRDIKFILDDFEEVTYEQNKHRLIQVKQPKTKLILPNNKIKV
jgi:DNA-binding LytR/AlgR family response regulator